MQSHKQTIPPVLIQQMSTNISEFERTKPKQTLETINNTINKYQNLIRPVSEIVCVQDEMKNIIYNDFLKELNTIKYYFLQGK